MERFGALIGWGINKDTLNKDIVELASVGGNKGRQKYPHFKQVVLEMIAGCASMHVLQANMNENLKCRLGRDMNKHKTTNSLNQSKSQRFEHLHGQRTIFLKRISKEGRKKSSNPYITVCKQLFMYIISLKSHISSWRFHSFLHSYVHSIHIYGNYSIWVGKPMEHLKWKKDKATYLKLLN